MSDGDFGHSSARPLGSEQYSFDILEIGHQESHLMRPCVIPFVDTTMVTSPRGCSVVRFSNTP